MRYHRLGNTGLVVSEICLGTMTFGGHGMWTAIGEQDEAQATTLVRGAIDAGVNFIDTANVYSNGASEELLGKALKNLGIRRDEIVVATKAHGRVSDRPSPNDEKAKAEAERRASALNVNGQSRKHLFHAIDDSLNRLGLDYVDLY